MISPRTKNTLEKPYVASVQAGTDEHVAMLLAGENWHTLSAKETMEAIALRAKGLLGPHRRVIGGDNGCALCQVGEYICPVSL